MKRTLLMLVLLAPVLLFLPSCQEQEAMEHQAEQIDMDAVKAEIAAMEEAFAVADNAKDADAVMAYYADDAQSLTYNAPTDVGKAAIKASVMKGFEDDTLGTTVSFQVTGVWAAGDYATETGTSKTMDKDGNVVRTGKYMTLFEKRDGKYVAIRDCYNRDDNPCK